MSKTIEINGEVFEVKRSKYVNVSALNKYAYRWLHNCYTKPSTAKMMIFEHWLRWATEAKVDCFGVSSYNAQFFTLQGLVFVDGVQYVLSITPKHNYAYTVE